MMLNLKGLKRDGTENVFKLLKLSMEHQWEG